MVKCYTKKKKDGNNYTTCVEGQKKTKSKVRKISIKQKAKPKPKPKGVMSIQKKIKGTKKLKNKSTIKPLISKPKAKPKPKAKAPKKLSAGKAVLLTQMGFMNMVGKAVITKKEKRRRIEVIEKSINRNVAGGETMLRKKK